MALKKTSKKVLLDEETLDFCLGLVEDIWYTKTAVNKPALIAITGLREMNIWRRHLAALQEAAGGSKKTN